jgi:hypothetical protein
LIWYVVETLAGLLVCGMLGLVADADGHSWLAWAGVTFVLCAASLLLPLPLVRMVLAGYAAVGLMFAYNLVRPVPR